MPLLRLITLAGIAMTPLIAQGGEKTKKESDVWAKIVVGFITAEQSKKGIEVQGNAAVGPDFELNLIAEKLGANLSMKAIRAKHGAPTKVESYRSKDSSGKIFDYQVFHYPPINFTTKKNNDQVETINAPKRL